MKELLSKDLEIEVINSDEDTLVLQRTVSKKFIKKLRRYDNIYSKITIHLFDPKDLENLQRIQKDLQDKTSQNKSDYLYRYFKVAADFLMK